MESLTHELKSGSRIMKARHEAGFTLIELMIAVAIVAVLSMVAIPLYSGYIDTSRQGVLVNNLSLIEIFQEDFRLRTGAYMLVAADAAAIEAGIGWTPQDDGTFTYSIANGGGGNYNVTGVDGTGVTVCMQFPGGVRC